MPVLTNTMKRPFVLRFKNEPGTKNRASLALSGGASELVIDAELESVSGNAVVKALLGDGSLVVGDGVPEISAELDDDAATLEDVVGMEMAELMAGIGVTSVEELATSDASVLTGLKGVGEARAEKFIAAAQEALASGD